jgi:hypothetical protein
MRNEYYKNRIILLQNSTKLPLDITTKIIREYCMIPSAYIITKFMRKLMITLKNYRKIKYRMYDMNRGDNGIVRNVLTLDINEESNPLKIFYKTFDEYSLLCSCERCSGFERRRCVIKQLIRNRLLPYFENINNCSNMSVSYDIYISYINMLLQGKKRRVKKGLMKIAKICTSMGVLL